MASIGRRLNETERPVLAVGALISIFAIAGFFVLLGLKFGQRLFVDCAEAFTWGQHFLGGYGRHPPLTGWIAGVWYKIFPAESWSSYALSRVMNGLCLFGVYLVSCRVMSRRHALLVVLMMFVYPLFLGFKSDRYNNYQVLQTIVPFAVLSFLFAWNKRTALSGALLGLMCGLATITIYSGGFVVAATGLAALAHRDRWKFFASSAPYVALATYVLVLSPHLVWLWNNDFVSVRFASGYIKSESPVGPALNYVVYHITLLIAPIVVAIIALWPLKFSPGSAAETQHDLFPLTIIVAVFALGPMLAFIVLGAKPSGEWGDPFFILVPTLLLAYLPRLVILHSAIERSLFIAAATVIVYLGIASIYPWMNFRSRPDYPPFEPVRDLSALVTDAWRARMSTPLPIVISDLERSSLVAFYSKDHPLPVADFAPHQTPWLKYPQDYRHLGYVGLCLKDDKMCSDELFKLDPPGLATAIKMSVNASREFAGVTAKPVVWDMWMVAPQP